MRVHILRSSSVDVIGLGKLNWKGMYICFLEFFFITLTEKLVIKFEELDEVPFERKMF